MKVILQRVSEANVCVAGQSVGRIGQGWLVLIGVTHDDTPEKAQWLAEKVAHLRAFEDDSGKMNLSVLDVSGSLLVVSNFTLYADCQKGRRPSFADAAKPESAKLLIQDFVDHSKSLGLTVAEGVFGADMKVSLVNDGPVTMIISTEDTLKV